MIDTLRIVLTYKCNKRCNYCYQKKYEGTIDIDVLENILKIINADIKYVTVMGGEIFIIPNYMDYLKLIASYYNVEKKIITAMDMNFDVIRKLGYNITTSNNYKGDSINIYYNGETLENIYKALYNKPITICSEMRKNIKPPVIKGIKPVKKTKCLYEYPDMNIRYFTNDYEHNEIIITPYGRITFDFEDIKNGL